MEASAPRAPQILAGVNFFANEDLTYFQRIYYIHVLISSGTVD
jgi:hypothetical protein